MDRRALDRALVALAALAGGVAAGALFAQRPPMRVRVGMQLSDERVPAHYQASVFFAWSAFVAALALDVARGRERASWPARAALLGATAIVAAQRLSGRSPLSGHAVFLAAMLASDPAQTPFGRSLAAVGLAVTAVYKLRWQDARGLALSSAVGALIGLGCRALTSPRGRWHRARRAR
jgi:hypothetical protein